MKTKKRIYFVIAALLTISSVALLGEDHKNQIYHIDMPVVEFSGSNIPVIEAVIEGKVHRLKVDLGSSFLVTLSENSLKTIEQKKRQGRWKSMDFKGNRYKEPAYLIPTMHIGELTLTNIVAKQSDNNFTINTRIGNGDGKESNDPDEEYSSLGWPLLEKVNLLLDFRRSLIIASNDKENLEENGYYLDVLARVPFEMTSQGLIFLVDTDVGTKKLLLDTGSTLNHIRHAPLYDQNCKKESGGLSYYTTSKFVMGQTDFGSMDLYPLEISRKLSGDGLLGMDFLEDHIVYLDCPNKTAYIGTTEATLLGKNVKEQTYHIEMPVVEFSDSNTPIIEVVIEGKVYHLEVDLGYNHQLALRENLLKTIEKKKPHGLKEWIDFKGNSYEAPTYLIPRMTIGDLTFTNIDTKQIDGEDKESNDPDEEDGTLGWPLLEKVNLLLDFRRSLIIASNDREKLEKNGYSLDVLAQVPFEMTHNGLIFLVDTDVGTKRFSLETGFALTYIRHTPLYDQNCWNEKLGLPYFSTSKFVMGQTDFGVTDLYLREITPELEIDGILGMDFLEGYIVYLDFPNKTAYIGTAD